MESTGLMLVRAKREDMDRRVREREEEQARARWNALDAIKPLRDVIRDLHHAGVEIPLGQPNKYETYYKPIPLMPKDALVYEVLFVPPDDWDGIMYRARAMPNSGAKPEKVALTLNSRGSDVPAMIERLTYLVAKYGRGF